MQTPTTPLPRHTLRFAHAACLLLACGLAGCDKKGGPTTPSQPSQPPVTVTVTSLAVAGDTLFTAAGQTRPLTATARLSDNTDRVVTATAAWESSAPGVATVSAGVITAVAAGRARIAATYEGRSANVDIIVPSVATRPRAVRVLYLVPTDRPRNPEWKLAIQRGFADLQAWYRDQLGGPVFTLYDLGVEDCALPRDAAYYSNDTWNRLVADVQGCAPVRTGGQPYVWVLYADVVHACNTPGRIGAGTLGLTIMGRMDLQGLAGQPAEGDCGPEPAYSVGRYVGGAGHELGHAFGLPHPPGCDNGQGPCDSGALMWAGYSAYPNTYLREDEKTALRASPFVSLVPTGHVWDAERRPQ